MLKLHVIFPVEDPIGSYLNQFIIKNILSENFVVK